MTEPENEELLPPPLDCARAPPVGSIVINVVIADEPPPVPDGMPVPAV